VFDDVMLEKQSMIEKYYVRGRHNNVQCFYLAQNYFKVPRQTVRENASLICLFKQNGKSITHLYQDHCSTDMKYDEFKDLCSKAWSKPYGFLTLDLTKDKEDGKYKMNLDPINLV